MITKEAEENEEEFFDTEAEPTDLPFVIEANHSPAPSRSQPQTNDLLNESISVTTPMRTIKAIYAVQFINKTKKSNESDMDTCRIFINQENAMKFCKKDPDNRRFKMFKSFNEAYVFSYESSEIESGQAPSKSQVQASLTASLNGNADALSPSLMRSESKTPTQDAEKLPFSGPKKPEINELRLFIEKNNLEQFRVKVLSNPRFLISAGDSPIVVQEAFRYNCLHVCAKENRYEICEFLLNTLSSVSFIQRLYVNDTVEQSKARSNRLLDLYMNMPEKGLSETPLHFACKFGSLEVARLMLSYDVCSRAPLNKFGKTPEDLICSKLSTRATPVQMKSLFEDCYYLPLYRDEEKGNVIIEKPCAKLVPSLEELPDKSNKSVTLNTQLSKSQHKLAGFVGPISPTNANAIYDRLKSPARLRQSPNNLDILRSDDFKGYERIVRKMTDEMNMPWSEYWWFLGSFCDFKKHEGLSKLETYLDQKKLQAIIEQQVQSVQNILKEKLNDCVIVNKLNEFLKVIDELKRTLDLRENQLSSKYESFLKTMKQAAQQASLPLSISKQDTPNQDDLTSEKIINDILTQYMTVIIELSKLDKTTKCYFNLYKTSKSVLELLSCQKMFEQFYLSPVFNQKYAMSSTSVSQQAQQNDLSKSLVTNRSDIYNKKTNDRMRLERGLFNNSSDEEEEEDANESYEDQDELKMNQDKIDELSAMLESQNMNDEDDDDDLNQLISKMSLKTTNDLDKQETKENISTNENLKYVHKDTPFRKPVYPYSYANGTSSNNVNNQKFKLFMFGDTPSKLDRAVFLALQDIKIDLNYYPILNEWYNYMKSCDQNEMIHWTSPMKKTPFKPRTYN